MEIETKYNLGQEVFLIRDNEVQKHKIRSIYFTLSTSTSIQKFYSFADMFDLSGGSEYHTEEGIEWWHEEKLFPTKEELLKSL